MKPIMYLFLNQELGMSTGKAAAQVAHAAVNAFEISRPEIIEEWKIGGHYTKVVLLAENSDQLSSIERYLNDRGFETSLVIDEGRTEIQPFTATALGVEIVDKSDLHVAASFGEFKVYRDKKVAEVSVRSGTPVKFGYLAQCFGYRPKG